ncbi:hypothetical protein AB0C18_37905 [Nonomuraea muscovyensis]|uniref:hypothetical protein n=1 Tax=Nonomuraea muscovyensis TaxID=1124761 RepID=UPI0033E7A79E
MAKKRATDVTESEVGGHASHDQADEMAELSTSLAAMEGTDQAATENVVASAAPVNANGSNDLRPDANEEGWTSAADSQAPQNDWEHSEPSVTLGEALRVDQRIGRSDGTVIGVQYVKQYLERMLAHHDLRASYIEACKTSFVAPNGLYEWSDGAHGRETAAARLKRTHIVVLVAEANVGRHYAGVHLLWTAGDVTILEVRREPGDHIDITRLARKEGSGWLLDLRNEKQIDHAFGRSLVAFERDLASRRSYLVVITPPTLWEKGGRGAEDLAFFLESPRAEEIISSRLKKATPPIDPYPWLEDSSAEQIRQRIQNLTPEDALLWATTIENVHRSPLPHDVDEKQEDGETWEAYERRAKIKLVLKARDNWHRHLLDWHLKHQDSRERNFLIAASLLEGTPAGEIFTAATSLATDLGEDEPEVKGQQGAGIIELSHHVGADLIDGETLRFIRPDFADAALDYFWIDRQHLQEKFLTWMCGLPKALQGFSAQVAVERITAYTIKWTVRKGNLSLLIDLTKKWAPLEELREPTAELITALCLDPKMGSAARALLLEWAKGQRGATADIQMLVAKVCGGPLASYYPQQMLRRLVYLAQAPDESVSAQVAYAMRSLWEQPHIRERLFDQLTQWCMAADPARKAAGAQAFLALAEIRDDAALLPAVLQYEIEIRQKLPATRVSALARGWQALLENPDLDPSSALDHWLGAAILRPGLQPLVEQILVEAAKGYDLTHPDQRRAVQLTTLLYRWQPADQSPAPADRVGFRDRIIEHLYVGGSVRAALPAPDKLEDSAGADQNTWSDV